MKFIARKGSPDIPLDVLEAQESDKLVIFCGAGISRPARLPGVEGLVKMVYKVPDIYLNKLEYVI